MLESIDDGKEQERGVVCHEVSHCFTTELNVSDYPVQAIAIIITSYIHPEETAQVKFQSSLMMSAAFSATI